MSEQAFSLIEGSQARYCKAAGMAASQKQTPREELMEHRLTPETELEPLEFLFRMNGTDCFPLSELVANTGKAKSGKTLFLSIVMACCLKKNVLGLERIRDTPIRVLWYDTEQSAQSTQRILVRRVIPLSEYVGDINDQFFIFNVRGIGWEKRRELLELAIVEFKPGLVIVDGVKDLVTDINDGTQATVVVEDQMAMAQKHHCCIVDVLHQNKSDADRNMRGWIGTELTNKAFEVWACSQIPNTDTFKVEHFMSRMDKCEEHLYYKLDENALPVSCDKPDEQPREANGRYASKKKAEPKKENPKYTVNMAALNQDYILHDGAHQNASDNPEEVPWDLVKLFTDGMEGYKNKRFNTLMATIMHIANIVDNKYYYHLLERAKQAHIISPGKDENGQQCFFLISPEMRKHILAQEAEELRKQREPQQTVISFADDDVPESF